MKTVFGIISVIIVVAFFTFFNIKFEKDKTFDFITTYKNRIEFSEFEVNKTLLVGKNNDELFIQFYHCKIDTVNMKEYSAVSKEIALELNKNINSNNEFVQFNFKFHPSDSEGIKLTDLITIYDFGLSYETKDLNEELNL